MRDYSKVSGQFWTGRTGKRLRGDMEAQLVALYLMTSPHANMIGVYQVPILYIAHETGLSIEGASKGLDRCIKAAFCSYDYETETVFVIEMAAHQVGDAIQGNDKRRPAIQKMADAIAEPHIYQAFMARYGECYGLKVRVEMASPIEGASKPLPSQKQEQEQKKSEKQKSLGQQAARFAEFWAAYPVKKGKADALKSWTRRGLDAIADRILADVEARKVRDRQWLDGFIPHGSTYVNGRGWEDDIEERRPREPMPQAVGGDVFGGAL